MTDKPKLKFTEIHATRLADGAKYLFIIDPLYADQYEYMVDELDRLIGNNNYAIFSLPSQSIKVYALQDELHGA